MATEERWDARVGTPAGPLRGHVTYHGYDMRGAAAGTHRGLPSPSLTLIVTFGEPLTMLDATGAPMTHDTVLGGLHTVPETIVHRGRQSGVQLALDPLAARALLGLPAAAIAGTTVATPEVLGPAATSVPDRAWCTAMCAVPRCRVATQVPQAPPAQE